MKNIVKNILFALATLCLMVACGSKKTSGREMISGATSKVWREHKETNAAGKNNMTSTDKNSMMQFYANGSFTANTTTDNTNGTWTYDESSKGLTLQMGGQNIANSFTVEDLSEKHMKLKAADGSEMILEAE